MDREKYTPSRDEMRDAKKMLTPEQWRQSADRQRELAAQEMVRAEEALTDPQREQSKEREEVFESLRPPVFDEATNTALLHIDKRLLHFGVFAKQAQEHGLQRKDEFHVTVIGNVQKKKIARSLEGLPPRSIKKRIAKLRQLIEETDWQFGSDMQFYHIQKEYRILKEDKEFVEDRESYIQVLHIPALDEFYHHLNKLFGLSLQPPFPHITLYTKSTNPEHMLTGIGISSRNGLQELQPKELRIP